MTSTRESSRAHIWTEEDLQQAAALRDAGWAVQSIAAQLGLTYATTRRLLVRAGRVAGPTAETLDGHRGRLLRLARELRRGRSLAEAAAASGVTVYAARLLIRQAADLLPEPPTADVRRQASAVRAVLVGSDVRAAARDLHLDPWWALLLLVVTGSEPVSMQPLRDREAQARAELMAARRAEGESYEQIGQEFHLGRERVRRILISTYTEKSDEARVGRVHPRGSRRNGPASGTRQR